MALRPSVTFASWQILEYMSRLPVLKTVRIALFFLSVDRGHESDLSGVLGLAVSILLSMRHLKERPEQAGQGNFQ